MIQIVGIMLVVLLLWVVAWHLPSVKGRQILLLVASYLFYANWGIGFLVALIMSSLMTYACGLGLRRRVTAPRFWLGITVNLLPLVFLKYLPPLLELGLTGSWQYDLARQIVMPVGMSFWTFQALSYLFDIYLGEELDPSLVEFCLYMAFWPTVVSGPVCRLPRMLPQFRRPTSFTRDNVSAGSLRVIQGLTMKVVLAQILGSGWTPGEGVVAGFDQIKGGWGGIDVWLLGIGFGFLLFFDFAGYSHMVIGTARVFGIQVPENFHRPFLSTTPSVFWTRWHMSLSFWIRDYVFSPLAAAGRRYRWWPHVVLVISMTLFGLWHGAKLTFIVFGIYHGLILVLHRVGQQIRRWFPILCRPHSLGPFLSWGTTFLLMSLGFICFRANTLGDAVSMCGAAFSPRAYWHFAMPRSFYILTSAIVGGYFALEGMKSVMLSLRLRYRQALTEGTLGARGLSPVRTVTVTMGALVHFFCATFWWWFAPVVSILVLFASLAMNKQSGAVTLTPFIYTLF